ncbi:MAG: hypothetical protein ACLFSQ_12880 [Candidatus Zixiibacteriota bacterium]
MGDRYFGFRGGMWAYSLAPIDVSIEIKTFHIVEANFHFNRINASISQTGIMHSAGAMMLWKDILVKPSIDKIYL